MQVQFSLLNYIEVSSSRPCQQMVNNEHQALLPMRLRGLLHLMPSRSSFVYFDRVIAYSDDYWFRNKSSTQMPAAAGWSTNVSGDTYAQRLSGSEGDGAYSNEGLSHTDLPTSGAYIPSSRPAVFWLFPCTTPWEENFSIPSWLQLQTLTWLASQFRPLFLFIHRP